MAKDAVGNDVRIGDRIVIESGDVLQVLSLMPDGSAICVSLRDGRKFKLALVRAVKLDRRAKELIGGAPMGRAIPLLRQFYRQAVRRPQT